MIKIKYFFSASLLFSIFFTFIFRGCASAPGREVQSSARVYDRPYDAVWDAVENLVWKELKCTPKKAGEKKGLIETEWAHRIDTEGTTRWMLRAEVKKVPNGIQLLLDKRVELRDIVSKNIHKYKKESNEPQTGGWRKKEIERKELEDLYRKIEQRLGY
ncbi:MAG: hypothetical protein WCQ99_01050 [Pseudomonadota bacterium]